MQVIQKLFEHGTSVQKDLMVITMKDNILQLSMHMYGCRVVQKVRESRLTVVRETSWTNLLFLQAIENITSEQQTAFVGELEKHVLQCVKDANGNHVRSFPPVFMSPLVLIVDDRPSSGHSKDHRESIA